MRGLWRWFKRLLLAAGVLVIALLAPVGYNETMCRGPASDEPFSARIAPAEHRAESATFLTYPEWHIVFAYDDYAKVLETGDPHEFGYIRSITGFWSALCNLTQAADAHGGAPETKNMVYVIGVSFTAELLGKALYEETLGRLAAWWRGPEQSASDIASARMARAYADFLHQVPWYKYDFPGEVAALRSIAPNGLRDRERQLALGLEFGVKTRYAQAIAQAVDAVGPAKLTIRSIIGGLSAEDLRGLGDITIVSATPEGVEIETPRYAAFTQILRRISLSGGQIIEIAGNDEILVTLTGTQLPEIGAGAPVLAALDRQGYDDRRWLVHVQLTDLANLIRVVDPSDAALEHIFDY